MSNRVLPLLLLACLAAGTARAADDPMLGQWKLNPQKSRLVDEMKVASLGGNKYSFDFGGPSPETITLDGADQPGLAGTTLAVTLTPDHWTVVRKKDGRILLKAIWTLSKDGNQLHDNYTQFGDNGTSTHVDYLYDRKGDGQGFAGDWLSTTQQIETAYVVEVRPYQGDGLSIVASSEGVTKNVKFDGRDYPNPGSRVGRTASARRVNERTIELTDKIGARIVDTEQISVSEDGRILTMTVHVPKHTEPDILVFDKK
ncbi:MAG TPA: hypothetical protein VMD29_10950 [Terracidiphilus sp.]|nr:hypothetical protein [Terracidiphilus sp.]